MQIARMRSRSGLFYGVGRSIAAPSLHSRSKCIQHWPSRLYRASRVDGLLKSPAEMCYSRCAGAKTLRRKQNRAFEGRKTRAAESDYVKTPGHFQCA